MYENDNVFTINSNYKFYVYNFNYSIIIMKLWIARDENNDLALYTVKPTLYYDNYYESAYNSEKIDLDENLFPEVTFENSPQMVELKLVKEE